jgi:glycosyltransferase involved in cell wall biosynthesis
MIRATQSNPLRRARPDSWKLESVSNLADVSRATGGAARTSSSQEQSPDTHVASSRGNPGGRDVLSALFVLNSLRIGGSETKVVRILNGMLRNGVRAGIACLDVSDQLLNALDPAVPVWHLERRGKFSWSAARKLRVLIREQRPRTVLAVNLYPALYVSIALLRAKPRPRALALLNTTFFKNGDEWRRSFYGPILRRLDGLVYGCELQRAAWHSQLHSANARSQVIYNGVDIDYFAPPDDAQRRTERQGLGISPDAFVIGTVGRLSREKNQAVLIDALAALREKTHGVHLLLVGDGPLKSDLYARAAELQMQSCVTFAGAQSDVRPALSAMDVFVLPSHTETFSNAALEAMAMAKPVILSKVGGASEMVRDGIDGFTLEARALHDTLPVLLARLREDQDLRESLGRAARERIARDFSLDGMVARYASLVTASSDAKSR